MSFLFTRQTSKNLDLTYEGGGQHLYQSYIKRNYSRQTDEGGAKDFAFNQDMAQLRDLCRAQVRQILQKIFESHGAREIDTLVCAPIQQRYCQFVSREQLIWGRFGINKDVLERQTNAI